MSRTVDAALISDMLRRHGAELELYAAQWTQAADDCVQEALMELARQPTAPKNPRAWLYRVVRNRALNYARAAGRRAEHEQFAIRLRPINDAAATAEDVADALATLPADCREIIVLRVWGQLSWREVAEVTGLSSSTAERKYQTGLETLRKIWEIEPCPTTTDCPQS
ncbi:RNA polymerase sigma factor [Pirellulales bacterium]|nr:RNA polymerase sigma factor [Pirellulales bacterium]